MRVNGQEISRDCFDARSDAAPLRLKNYRKAAREYE
jgi:hypothetical protein